VTDWTLGRRGALIGGMLAAGVPRRIHAEQAGTVTIGVLNDQAGPYADSGGPGSVGSARMAVRDFGGSMLGRKIEVLSADTRNKPDIAAAIARE
jgi:branched-chain amino acid transport system substrate-binding protein